jgi:hypothetical protein
MPGWMNKTVGKNTALWKSAKYSIPKPNSFVAAFCKKCVLFLFVQGGMLICVDVSENTDRPIKPLSVVYNGTNGELGGE